MGLAHGIKAGAQLPAQCADNRVTWELKSSCMQALGIEQLIAIAVCMSREVTTSRHLAY